MQNRAVLVGICLSYWFLVSCAEGSSSQDFGERRLSPSQLCSAVSTTEACEAPEFLAPQPWCCTGEQEIAQGRVNSVSSRSGPESVTDPETSWDGSGTMGSPLASLGTAHPLHYLVETIAQTETGLEPGFALPAVAPLNSGIVEPAASCQQNTRRNWAKNSALGQIPHKKFSTTAGGHARISHLWLYIGVVLAPLGFGLLVFGLVIRVSYPQLVIQRMLLPNVQDGQVVNRTRSMENWRQLWRRLEGLEDCKVKKGLTRKMIEKIPIATYKGDKNHPAIHKCIICLNDLRDGDVLRTIPCCVHQFHSHCVDPWLEESSTCPLCRRDVELKKGTTTDRDTATGLLKTCDGDAK